MNEDIDLTIRKLFLKKLDNGQRAVLDDEWFYMKKHGEEGSSFSPNNQNHEIMLGLINLNYRDTLEFFEDESHDFRYSCIDAAHKILDMHPNEYYPMGDGTQCDCCGKHLNMINSKYFSICESCDHELEDRQREFQL